MKTQLIRNVSVALLAAAYMFGQESHRVTAHIPFGFHVGTSMLPAGQYMVAADTRTGTVRLRSDDFKSTVVALSNLITPRTKADKNRLVFNRYGNQYFLSQIWVEDGVEGRSLPKSKKEAEVASSAPQATRAVMASK